jgi:hypothetical protein
LSLDDPASGGLGYADDSANIAKGRPMRRLLPSPVCLAPLCLFAAAPASGQDGGAPPAIQALEACSAIEGAEEKAACYDAALAALKGEIEEGATIAVTREQVEEAQRESVGLEHARLPGGLTGAPPEAPKGLTLRVVSFGATADGRLTFVTDTGQRWSQVEARRIRLLPDPPLDAELKPGMGNTFFVSLGGRDAGRMRRDR